MSDLIDRQAAIKTPLSASFENHDEIKSYSKDTISRQAAIDALKQQADTMSEWSERYTEQRRGVLTAVNIVEDLPPAQPEPFGTINHAGPEHPLSDGEIIPRLREIRDQVGGSYAIDRAIELLTAQPEPCEDAVSRKAVKDGFVEMCSLICPYTEKQRHTMCGSCLLGTAFDVLEATQPVTPKQRTGHWQITDAYPHNVYCSECHKRFAQTHWAVWEDGSLPRNFCPNCGADMRGEQE